MRQTYPRYGRVIAISSFLARYYASRGCDVIRVPPTLDVAATQFVERPGDGRLKLAYAGMPGKKDLLAEIVAGLRLVDPHHELIRLQIIGPDERTLASAGISTQGTGIQVLGHVSRQDAIDCVANADFVPLLRSDQRYAHAGFPTKVAEAMAVGTPVICNLTSDLGEVVADGRTGFVCGQPTAQAFADALAEALALSQECRAGMRAAARHRAEEYFDFRTYADALNGLVRRAVEE
ncbi:hypothetical protein GCM10011584_29060 [Nocardioides phosphati]|uniref:Glycosyl transferase family 1 domain-containing protein n=2 Tax=Nocardioides phosphati TaxID=1867775 RepID=A0ABQ2NDM8_9ACTN|nr:hypothetical protein GCM10011584_29060 [Nocardioides phosphati]